jgi:hypothetical protein
LHGLNQSGPTHPPRSYRPIPTPRPGTRPGSSGSCLCGCLETLQRRPLG